MRRAFCSCQNVQQSYSVCLPHCLSVSLAQSILLPPHWSSYLLSYHPTNPNLECLSRHNLERKQISQTLNQSSFIPNKPSPYLGKSNHPQQAMTQTAFCYCNIQCPTFLLLLCLSVWLSQSIRLPPHWPPNQSQPINSRHIQGTCWKHSHPERKANFLKHCINPGFY